MSFLDFTMLPGGALMEAVTEFTAETKQAQNIATTYSNDTFTSLRDVCNSIKPCYDGVLDLLRNVSLSPSDKATMANDVSKVERVAKCVATEMPKVFSRIISAINAYGNYDYAYQYILSQAKVFTINRTKIIRDGLESYTHASYCGFPVIGSEFNDIRTLLVNRLIVTYPVHGDTMLTLDGLKMCVADYEFRDFEYFESLDDMIGTVMSLGDRFQRLLKTRDCTDNIFQKYKDATSGDRTANEVDYSTKQTLSVFSVYMKYVSDMLRYVMEGGYDILIKIDDETLSGDAYKSAMSKIITSVCNAFYIGAITMFNISFILDNMAEHKRAMDQHVDKIVLACNGQH